MPMQTIPQTAYEFAAPICPSCFSSLLWPPDRRPDVWIESTCSNCTWTGMAVFVRSQKAVEFGVRP